MQTVYVHTGSNVVRAVRLLVGGMCLACGAGWVSGGEAGTVATPSQIHPLRQESIKVGAIQESPREAPVPAAPASGSAVLAPAPELPLQEPGGGLGYDPSGRRDPFAPVIEQLQPGKSDENLPPLQRVSLTELNLIAIVWGAYGYTAMVQTPEGYGYTVRRGTRLGQNNGVVSAITERGIIVQERFTDVYGKKQEREYVKLLHPKEGVE